MPGAAIWVRLGIGCSGKGRVNATSIRNAGRAVGARANERVREFDPWTDVDKMRVNCGGESGHLNPEYLAGSVEQGNVTEGLRRRREDKKSGLCRERVEAL